MSEEIVVFSPSFLIEASSGPYLSLYMDAYIVAYILM